MAHNFVFFGEILVIYADLIEGYLKYPSKEERNSCRHERQIRENNSVEQKAKPCQ